VTNESFNEEDALHREYNLGTLSPAKDSTTPLFSIKHFPSVNQDYRSTAMASGDPVPADVNELVDDPEMNEDDMTRTSPSPN